MAANASPPPALSPDEQLADELAKYADDPLGFVRFAYPWKEAGTELADESGPDAIQTEFLTELGKEVRQRKFDGVTPVMPILMSETSGHGTGKSSMGAWLADWILSTRPYSIGTVTASTFQQLQSRTWAAIQRWTRLCITAHWFDIQASGIFSKVAPDDWKVEPQTCRKENAQAFAGQHAKRSSSWYLFDEASNVPDEVWEVAYGGLTDGEPMMFAWGQPAKNTGEFYKVCFGKQAARWNTRRVDSRSSRFTNKELIAQWIEDYGEDSDFVRVRVFGLPPTADELQYIDTARVTAAQTRKVEVLDDEPLIVGFDVSGGGAAWNVLRFRCGLDARSIKPIRITGQAGRDRAVLIARAAEVLRETHNGRKVAAMFVDSAFGAPIVERLHTLGFKNVHETNFGGRSPNIHQLNMRAYMWNVMKDWLLKGAIDELEALSIGLSAPGYHMNRENKLVLEGKQEMQKRGEASPDDADALALTFAQKVAPVAPKAPPRRLGAEHGPWS
jgi:hypothetical protein